MEYSGGAAETWTRVKQTISLQNAVIVAPDFSFAFWNPENMLITQKRHFKKYHPSLLIFSELPPRKQPQATMTIAAPPIMGKKKGTKDTKRQGD